MLNLIVKKKISRIYDVASIIFFSAGVNVITTGFSIYHISSFIAFTCAGWCFYSLYYKMDNYLEKNAGMESATIININEAGEASTFIRYYIDGAICFIFGVLFFWQSTRL